MMLASILYLLRAQNKKHMHTQESELHFTARLPGLPVHIQTPLRCCLQSIKLYCLSLPDLRDHLFAFQKANIGAVLLTVPCFTERLMWQYHFQPSAGILMLLPLPLRPMASPSVRRHSTTA